MDSGGTQVQYEAPAGLLRIEDCLDEQGGIVLPPDTTLISLIDRNIAHVGDQVAYRYLDHSHAEEAVLELTWTELGVRLRAVAARLQQVAARGDRVAILAPQGLDYVVGFFAAIKAGNIAVPLFAPELQGHAERLETALLDSRPTTVLTTAAAAAAVQEFLAKMPDTLRPRVELIDEVADSEGDGFTPIPVDPDDISHLQYTSGSTRPPVGVEITHRAVGTNLLQMILSIDLLNRNTHGLSWLPLYHDMGLSMIGFPAVYGGHSTLMSPTAFIRRPQRWIRALSDASKHGRVITAAPNFAYEWTAQRGAPAAGENLDLSNVVLIIGSEPVNPEVITAFNEVFAPHGLPPTAFKPSYGIAEATLLISTIAPAEQASVVYFDREQLTAGRAVRVDADAEGAVAHVSCGHPARSLWAVIVDPATVDGAAEEVADGRVGEIWLHGDNIGRGYWGRPDETRKVFGVSLHSRLASDSHAEGLPEDATWLRTGDLGVYFEGQFYVTGRMADLVQIDGRSHYPQDIEATVADASPLVRRGYVTAFTVTPDGDGDGTRLVVIAERAARTKRADPEEAGAAIRAAVAARHGLTVADLRFLPAGAIPRTTSGKLARLACRDEYQKGTLGVR
ncbi:fatty-acid--CoA ligase [Mycolicibacterium conceptionense]|uniref:Fatty-acid--CoA ligase n=1 Tax=Mycolicibacterium conceptionense TaxID=451644 RepID=A0A1A1Y4Y8_9MYCO|nr:MULTISPECIES: fatty acyl-AMP ligase [Mycolicibacterium]MCW1823340.1 fatty acyl-AMP ligase [Mycolicibacterium senegalense]OBB06503.1 fatty-acid--CoA ligase [Mycolicibacterium conceptionense]OBF00777.1 fatty-acid--CoA ligase [Mycolicibacterium conceptionense]OBF26370.1 fatty-acid--CoA ligase [Mycolicibacterium conceptionense]OBF36345.1 fatty-acid--CoA ligase [Mycolicibacterium conceptionense]